MRAALSRLYRFRPPVLFLDIDGVLNRKAEGRILGQFLERDCTKALNHILKKVPPVRVVLSSSWRFRFTLEEWEQMLKEAGCSCIENRIIGKTPKVNAKLYLQRIIEIKTWLKTNFECARRYLVIDDNINVVGLPHVLTDPLLGLTADDAEAAIKYLLK